MCQSGREVPGARAQVKYAPGAKPDHVQAIQQPLPYRLLQHGHLIVAARGALKVAPYALLVSLVRIAAHGPGRVSTCASASSRLSTWSSLCPALNVMRKRSVFFATVGGRIAFTQKPR